MRRVVRSMLVLSACGGADAREQAVDQNSSTADDAGTGSIDAGLRDASPGRLDARVVLAEAPGGRDAGGRACDPLRQTGCEAGRQCDLTASGFACVVAGELAPFQRCAAPGTAGLCRPGSLCLSTLFDDARCAAYCDPATGSGCASNGQTCVPLAEAGGALGACMSAHQCSPVAQDCDELGQSCAWAPLGAICVTPSDSVPNGGPCTSAGSCEAGSTCVDDGAGATRCFRQCDPAARGADCTTDERCEAFAEVGAGQVGACRFGGTAVTVE